MRNKYFYPIFKLKAKSWIRYWLLKKTEFKGKLSEILEGFSFTLNNTLAMKFNLFEIYGNSIQDGTPSPENEVSILSSGENGSITEKIVNENYLSLSEATVGTAGVTTNISETKMKFSGRMVSVTNIFNTIREDKTIPAGTYKLSYKKLSGATSGSGDWAVYFNFYNANGTRIAIKNFASNDIAGGTVKDLVLSEDVAYYNYYAYCNSTSLIFNNLELGFMITKDTPTDYIAHKEQTYTIPVQQPMRSIGDVRDCFVKKSDGWYERHKIARKILDGTENWSIANGVFYSASIITDYITSLGNICLSNYYVSQNNVASTSSITENNRVCFYVSSQTIRLYIKDERFSTPADFKTWLAEKYASGEPIYIDYILAEPLDLPCTQSQIDILENPPKSFSGQTNVFSIDEVEPHLKIQYWESDTNG